MSLPLGQRKDLDGMISIMEELVTEVSAGTRAGDITRRRLRYLRNLPPSEWGRNPWD